jgi:hypothetical protein
MGSAEFNPVVHRQKRLFHGQRQLNLQRAECTP